MAPRCTRRTSHTFPQTTRNQEPDNMTSFPVLQNCGVLRTVLEFCRDNERVFLSHTSVGVREAVAHWIPSKQQYKTLTRPKIIPELFEEKDGVFSMDYPKTNVDFYFNIAMLGHSDIHRRGVRALTWFSNATGMTPVLDTSRVLMVKYLSENESLSDRQISVLEKRFKACKDEVMLVHDLRHWGIVQEMLKTTSSINRFIFFSRPDKALTCYADVFLFLHQRKPKAEYLDLSGELSLQTLLAFPLLAFDLTGIMLRRLSTVAMRHLLGTILSRPNDAKLDTLQFDGAALDVSVVNCMLDILDTLPIKRLLFSSTSIPGRGFTGVISVLGNTNIERLQFRKCPLTICEIVQCLFLPTVSSSYMKELFLMSFHIPEEAADALASCIESMHGLETLSLENCRLGSKCMEMVVQALKLSPLLTLNIGNNYIGEHAHVMFKNIGDNGRMRNLFIDECFLCRKSMKEYRFAKAMYKRRKTKLHVSAKECELELGIFCS